MGNATGSLARPPDHLIPLSTNDLATPGAKKRTVRHHMEADRQVRPWIRQRSEDEEGEKVVDRGQNLSSAACSSA